MQANRFSQYPMEPALLLAGAVSAATGYFTATVPVTYLSSVFHIDWRIPLEVQVFTSCVFGFLGVAGSRDLIESAKNTTGITQRRPHVVRGFFLTSIPGAFLMFVWLVTIVFKWSPVPVLFAIGLGGWGVYRVWLAQRMFEEQRLGLLWEGKITLMGMYEALLPVLVGGVTESFLSFYYPDIHGLPKIGEHSITSREVHACAGGVATLIAHSVLMYEWRRFAFIDDFRRTVPRAATVIAVPWAAMLATFALCAYFNRPDYTAWPLSAISGLLAWTGISHAVYPRLALIAGRDKVSLDYAIEQANASRPKGDNGHFFLFTQLPRSADILHFAFVGTPRSGKGVAITLFCQDAFRDIGAGKDVRALIWDAKQTAFEMLRGLKFPGKVHTFNPSDIRSVALSLKNMTRAMALDIVSTLFYDRPESNPFYTTMTRVFGGAAMVSMMLTAEARREELKKTDPEISEEDLNRATEITFEDWTRIMSDVELLRECLGRWAETRVVLTSVTDAETFSNIMASIAAYLGELKIVAGFWDHTPPENRISIEEWAKSEEGSVLILQRSAVANKAGEALNQVILKLVENALLGLPDSKTRRTYMILDELSCPPKWDESALTRLAMQGPSKGVCLIFALQSVAALRGLYGRDTADGLLGLTSHRMFFRIEDHDTQEFASRSVGKRRYWRGQITDSPTGSSVTWQKEDEYVIEPTDWATFGLSDFEVGVKAFAVSPITGPFYAHIPGAFLRSRIPFESLETPNFLPRPASHQELRPWTPEQRARLGFAPEAPFLTALPGGHQSMRSRGKGKRRRALDNKDDFRLLNDADDTDANIPDWLRKLNENAGNA